MRQRWTFITTLIRGDSPEGPRRGEVVLVDFPYSDHTGSKVRPALVGQADALNQRLDDTILALITGRRHRRGGAATQVVMDMTTAEGQQTGLRFNSVIQCENLLTYDQALIVRILGRLSATAIEQITTGLKAALGIP